MRIGQVLDNLLSNAVKFTPEGGSIAVRVGRGGDACAIEVEDSGPGIPADERGRLFERFFRSRDAIAREIPGTGLGLAVSRRIAEAHGGSLELVDGEGPGATFRLVAAPGAARRALPGAQGRRPPRRYPDRVSESAPAPSSSSPTTTRTSSTSSRYRLERSGYAVATATDGAEAVRLAGRALPGARRARRDDAERSTGSRRRAGCEATRRPRRIPVILLTAKAQDADVQEGFLAGADDYIRKPFSPRELSARVQAVLGRR